MVITSVGQGYESIKSQHDDKTGMETTFGGQGAHCYGMLWTLTLFFSFYLFFLILYFFSFEFLFIDDEEAHDIAVT